MKKVLFVSSTGGHLTELLRLEPLFKEYNYLLVTEATDTTKDMSKKYNMDYLMYGSRFYPFKYIFVVIYNIFKCLKILIKFKPDTIVSTGAHTGGIMCFIGKLFKAKIIYIETLAKIDSLSITGKNVYKIADKFYVQWKSLADKYEKAEYIGRLM
mgnify:CR=1 FL=1